MPNIYLLHCFVLVTIWTDACFSAWFAPQAHVYVNIPTKNFAWVSDYISCATQCVTQTIFNFRTRIKTHIGFQNGSGFTIKVTKLILDSLKLNFLIISYFLIFFFILVFSRPVQNHIKLFNDYNRNNNIVIKKSFYFYFLYLFIAMILFRFTYFHQYSDIYNMF